MDRFKIKQYIKMFMQNIILPITYNIGKIKKINPKLVIFADSHNDNIPYSMEDLYAWFKETDYKVVSMVKDCDKSGYVGGFIYMIKFMLIYSRAKYIFICDNFLPVASCKKRRETEVIQMWHAGGMLKKYGYDTPRDIPWYYKGNVFSNYSLIIVSDESCIPAYVSGMRAEKSIIKPLGLSRTDRFYRNEYIENCKEEFKQLYPEYNNKKIILWAPTFRGNAFMPKQLDLHFVDSLQQELGECWKIIVKLHPHQEKSVGYKSCTISTERLLPVIDVLVSDYSSVIYDYVLLNKPLVLYVPDLDDFIRNDQFYIDYNEMPGKIVVNKEELGDAIVEEFNEYSSEKIEKFKNKYLNACDGHAMKRLIEYLHL